MLVSLWSGGKVLGRIVAALGGEKRREGGDEQLSGCKAYGSKADIMYIC